MIFMIIMIIKLKLNNHGNHKNHSSDKKLLSISPHFPSSIFYP
jgi:hypothetical protein